MLQQPAQPEQVSTHSWGYVIQHKFMIKLAKDY